LNDNIFDIRKEYIIHKENYLHYYIFDNHIQQEYIIVNGEKIYDSIKILPIKNIVKDIENDYKKMIEYVNCKCANRLKIKKVF